jgi:putative membrane protein
MAMYRNPYQRFRNRELTLSDYLAIDRTVLANERTALAYGRTFLAMLVIGGSCIKFFDTWHMWIIGAVFISASPVIAGFGWHRYRRTQRYLAAALERQTGTSEHPLEPTQRGESSNADSSAPAATGG